jgi:predicted Rossmann-fold nucleotide-binding protein
MPIVLFGTAYWQGLIDWFRDTLIATGKISPGDLNLFMLTDNPKEAASFLVQAIRDASAVRPDV